MKAVEILKNLLFNLIDCDDCAGTGVASNAGGNDACYFCGGQGKKLHSEALFVAIQARVYLASKGIDTMSIEGKILR